MRKLVIRQATLNDVCRTNGAKTIVYVNGKPMLVKDEKAFVQAIKKALHYVKVQERRIYKLDEDIVNPYDGNVIIHKENYTSGFQLWAIRSMYDVEEFLVYRNWNILLHPYLVYARYSI